MRQSRLCAALIATLLVSACASPRAPVAPGPGEAEPLAFGAPAADGAARRFPLARSFEPMTRSPLAGRTIPVATSADIALRDREVVLTFDDGPMPGKTTKILAALEAAGVGATFLMVGQMARSYPEIARAVEQEGHTVGTHTEAHRNLRTLSTEAALAEIRRGEASIAKALGHAPAPFFRFPYLADTHAIRGRLANAGVTPIDVDIDSKDYFRDAPETLLARTLKAVETRGRGIILFHDIHARTAAMLPGFLAALEARGYKVVHLKPARETADALLASR